MDEPLRVPCPACGGSGRIIGVIPGVPGSVCKVSSPCDRCWPRLADGTMKAWNDGTAGTLPTNESETMGEHAMAEVVAERDHLAKQLKDEARAHTHTIEQRDRVEAWADMLAEALAPPDVIGEHSSENNPWANALEHADPPFEGWLYVVHNLVAHPMLVLWPTMGERLHEWTLRAARRGQS